MRTTCVLYGQNKHNLAKFDTLSKSDLVGQKTLQFLSESGYDVESYTTESGILVNLFKRLRDKALEEKKNILGDKANKNKFLKDSQFNDVINSQLIHKWFRTPFSNSATNRINFVYKILDESKLENKIFKLEIQGVVRVGKSSDPNTHINSKVLLGIEKHFLKEKSSSPIFKGVITSPVIVGSAKNNSIVFKFSVELELSSIFNEITEEFEKDQLDEVQNSEYVKEELSKIENAINSAKSRIGDSSVSVEDRMADYEDVVRKDIPDWEDAIEDLELRYILKGLVDEDAVNKFNEVSEYVAEISDTLSSLVGGVTPQNNQTTQQQPKQVHTNPQNNQNQQGQTNRFGQQTQQQQPQGNNNQNIQNNINRYSNFVRSKIGNLNYKIYNLTAKSFETAINSLIDEKDSAKDEFFKKLRNLRANDNQAINDYLSRLFSFVAILAATNEYYTIVNNYMKSNGNIPNDLATTVTDYFDDIKDIRSTKYYNQGMKDQVLSEGNQKANIRKDEIEKYYNAAKDLAKNIVK